MEILNKILVSLKAILNDFVSVKDFYYFFSYGATWIDLCVCETGTENETSHDDEIVALLLRRRRRRCTEIEKDVKEIETVNDVAIWKICCENLYSLGSNLYADFDVHLAHNDWETETGTEIVTDVFAY